MYSKVNQLSINIYPLFLDSFLYRSLQILSRVSCTIQQVLIHYFISNSAYMGFPYDSDGKESAGNAGEWNSFPGSGRSPRGGNGNPLQYSYLENPMNRGAWWATDHGIAKSWTGLSNSHTHTCTYTHTYTCTHTHTHVYINPSLPTYCPPVINRKFVFYIYVFTSVL